MAAGKYNFLMEQGAFFVFKITWVRDTGLVFDLTNFFVRMVLRTNKTDTTPIIALQEWSHADDALILTKQIVSGGPNGTFQLTLRPTETAALSFDVAEYDIEIQAATVNQTVGITGGYTSANLDVDNGASPSKGIITANAGTPYSVLAVDDYFRISHTDSTTNADGAQKIETVTDTIITCTHNLSGVDDATDTTIAISSYTLDDDVVRLLQGNVRMDKEVTQDTDT